MNDTRRMVKPHTNHLLATLKANLAAAGIPASVGINRQPHPYGIALFVRPRGKHFFAQAEAETVFKIVSKLGLKNLGLDFGGDPDLAGYCCAQGFDYLALARHGEPAAT